MPRLSTSESAPDRRKDWLVSIPLSDLNALVNQLESMDQLRAENAQLRREMDGLRNMFNELLTVFGELKKERKTG